MLVTKSDLPMKYVKIMRLHRRLMFSPYSFECVSQKQRRKSCEGAQVLVYKKVSVINLFFKY